MAPPNSSNSPTAARILLVDDNSMGLSARKSVLEELGYCITTCSSGDDALAQLGSNRFELVVTDYKMPRMNGTELIRRIRNQELSVPVILLSGFADTLGLSEDNTGADVVIQKSANEVGHLIRSVNRLLRNASRKPPGWQGPPSRGRVPKTRS
ncbi:MAG: response regulator [Bryobacteraceae bacterium]